MPEIDLSKATEILFTGIISALFTGVLAFFFQKKIEQWLSKSLEKFKVDLQLAAFEHQTRFTKLHEKRAEVIAELYALLVHAERKLTFQQLIIDQVMPGDWPPLQKELQEIMQFGDYFEKKRIYLPEDLCTKIQKMQSTLSGVALQNMATVTDKSDMRAKLLETSKRVYEQMTPIKQELETQFRDILGVASR